MIYNVQSIEFYVIYVNLTFPFKINQNKKNQGKKLISLLQYYKSIKILVLDANLTFQTKKNKKIKKLMCTPWLLCVK